VVNDLLHFLIVFDAAHGSLIELRRFEDADAAVEAYALVEGEYRDRPEVQVVLVASDSLETVKHTHASLFDTAVSSSDQLRALTKQVLESTAGR
jgi:hypothetical protein